MNLSCRSNNYLPFQNAEQMLKADAKNPPCANIHVKSDKLSRYALMLPFLIHKKNQKKWSNLTCLQYFYLMMQLASCMALAKIMG